MKPGEISSAFSGFMTGNVGETLLQVIIWLMVISAVGLVFFIAYIIITYKYKMVLFKTQGDGHGGLSIHKFKIELARLTKDKSWKTLFGRIKMEPFKDNQKYGNWCFGYESNNNITPGIVNIGDNGLNIEPVPYSIRKKTELELQQLEQDFAKMDAWEANKIFVYTLIGLGMVIVLAGFVLWLSYNKTGEIVPALENIGNMMNNVNTISGKG